MTKNKIIDMICALGGTNSLLKIYLSKGRILRKGYIKEVHEAFDKLLNHYDNEVNKSNDWGRVMMAIDMIRSTKIEEFILKGKNRRLVIDRFEINKNGTFWVFWFGSDQHIISYNHVPDDPNYSNADSYFDALEKSVNSYFKLKQKLENEANNKDLLINILDNENNN